MGHNIFRLKASLASFPGHAYGPQIFLMRGWYHWSQEAWVLDSPQSVPRHAWSSHAASLLRLPCIPRWIKAPSSSEEFTPEECILAEISQGVSQETPCLVPSLSPLTLCHWTALSPFLEHGLREWYLPVLSTQISRRRLAKTPWLR